MQQNLLFFGELCCRVHHWATGASCPLPPQSLEMPLKDEKLKQL